MFHLSENDKRKKGERKRERERERERGGTPGRERDLLLRVSETQMEFTRHGIFRNAARRTSINIARAVASIRAGNVSPRQEKPSGLARFLLLSEMLIRKKERERERERNVYQ